MSSSPNAALNLPAIADVYSVFAELTLAARSHFAGKAGGLLVLYAPVDQAGAAVALGASIAGAAALGVDPDEERLKLAIRNGVCDFSVNHLDEALRILKNEIRKKTSVSVGLLGAVDMWVGEMVSRGVQPDFVASALEERGSFVARGARVLGQGAEDPGELEDVWWSVETSPARWLAAVDALVAGSLGERSEDRLRWLRVAPRYLARVKEHYVKMAPEEVRRLERSILAQRASGALGVMVTLRRMSFEGAIEVEL